MTKSPSRSVRCPAWEKTVCRLTPQVSLGALVGAAALGVEVNPVLMLIVACLSWDSTVVSLGLSESLIIRVPFLGSQNKTTTDEEQRLLKDNAA